MNDEMVKQSNDEMMEKIKVVQGQVEELIRTLKRNQDFDQRRIGLGATDVHNGFNALIEGVASAD